MFWVVSLLSNHVSALSNWDQLIGAINLSLPAEVPLGTNQSTSPDPLIASLPEEFQVPLNWDMWAAVPQVSVVPVESSSESPYIPPHTCFPTIQRDPEIQQRFQIWLHETLVGETVSAETAHRIAHRLRQHLIVEDQSLETIQPVIGENYAAVELNQEVLFIIDDGFGIPPAQRKLGAVYWANNIRKALNLPLIDLATAQMASLGVRQTHHQFAGTASWYGPNFHGLITATGETFNQHALTAAHPSLPFGTYLEVRNQINGKTVVVRVNDRGPYIGDRSLDLSYAAAQCLESEQAGVVPYQATILQPGIPQWLAQTP